MFSILATLIVIMNSLYCYNELTARYDVLQREYDDSGLEHSKIIDVTFYTANTDTLFCSREYYFDCWKKIPQHDLFDKNFYLSVSYNDTIQSSRIQTNINDSFQNLKNLSVAILGSIVFCVVANLYELSIFEKNEYGQLFRFFYLMIITEVLVLMNLGIYFVNDVAVGGIENGASLWVRDINGIFSNPNYCRNNFDCYQKIIDLMNITSRHPNEVVINQINTYQVEQYIIPHYFWVPNLLLLYNIILQVACIGSNIRRNKKVEAHSDSEEKLINIKFN